MRVVESVAANLGWQEPQEHGVTATFSPTPPGDPRPERVPNGERELEAIILHDIGMQVGDEGIDLRDKYLYITCGGGRILALIRASARCRLSHVDRTAPAPTPSSSVSGVLTT